MPAWRHSRPHTDRNRAPAARRSRARYNLRMPYPEQFVAPMREELTRFGVEELRTASEVDQSVSQTGTRPYTCRQVYSQ